ncbi:Fe-S cluster assembly protein SufB, partial [Candidatus Caldipriscus sp.]|nr:Fe-S cluster assembly protein SufB [Candidatus Caldipriscus sp.]
MKEYELEFDYSKYAFRDEIEYKYIGKPGLSRELIEEISYIKGEPDWMREIRLKAYEHFIRRPMPSWGPDLSEVEEMFDKIVYYASPTDPGRRAKSWDEVPEAIRRTFERLGIPEAERKYLAGITAQYDS